MSFLPVLSDEIQQAIKDDYLIVVLISSHTQAAHQSINLPYGLGKSSLALWLMRGLTGSWDDAFSRMAYNPVDHYRHIEAGKAARHKGILWDDVQLTAPAEKSVPKHIVKLANRISVARPEVAVVVWTAPNISSIAAPLRRLVTHELIVYKRGLYEGQRYTYRKYFKDPKSDICKMYPCGDGEFPQLPPEMEARYNAWRVKEKMRLCKNDERAITNACHLYEAPLDGQRITLKGHVVKYGTSWMVRLPPGTGETLERKDVDIIV